MKGTRIGVLFGFLILSLLVVLCALPGVAGAMEDIEVSGVNYVLPEDSNFDYAKSSSAGKFFYGAWSMGTMHIRGMIEKETTHNSYAAYGATGDLYFRYDYSGAFQMIKEEQWHVEGVDNQSP